MDYLIEPRDPRSQSEGVVAGYAQTAQRWPAQPLARRRHGAAELAATRDLSKKLSLVRGDLAGHGDKRAIGQLIRIDARVVDEDLVTFLTRNSKYAKWPVVGVALFQPTVPEQWSPDHLAGLE